MKCVTVRGKPFEGFEIQNQRTSFLLLWSVFYFYILKPLLSAQPKYLTDIYCRVFVKGGKLHVSKF